MDTQKNKEEWLIKTDPERDFSLSGVNLSDLTKKATQGDDTKKRVDMVVVPLPVKNSSETTVKEWLAKLDEEVNEFKAAVLVFNELDDELKPGGFLNSDNAKEIALEGADVCTVIHSMCEQLDLGFNIRMQAQRMVNRKNVELKRT